MGDIGLRLVELPQNDLGMPIQHHTGFRRRHTALGSHQQLLPELPLERGQLLAQRRLGDMKDIGCLRQAADIDNFDKIFESSKVQRSPCRGLAARLLMPAMRKKINIHYTRCIRGRYAGRRNLSLHKGMRGPIVCLVHEPEEPL